MNDVTHTCWYDIPLMSNIPNLIYLAPTTCEEYIAMLNWSIEQNDHPVAIRVPLSVTHADKSDDTNYSLLNKSEIVHQGGDIAIVGLGSCMELAKESAERLKQQYGIDATIINPKFISGIDAELFSQLKRNHKVVVSLESGLMDGGYGEKISRFFGDTDVKVLVRGASKEFADRYSIPDILRKFRMTADRIAEDAYSLLK